MIWKVPRVLFLFLKSPQRRKDYIKVNKTQRRAKCIFCFAMGNFYASSPFFAHNKKLLAENGVICCACVCVAITRRWSESVVNRTDSNYLVQQHTRLRQSLSAQTQRTSLAPAFDPARRGLAEIRTTVARRRLNLCPCQNHTAFANFLWWMNVKKYIFWAKFCMLAFK